MIQGDKITVLWRLQAADELETDRTDAALGVPLTIFRRWVVSVPRELSAHKSDPQLAAIPAHDNRNYNARSRG